MAYTAADEAASEAPPGPSRWQRLGGWGMLTAVALVLLLHGKTFRVPHLEGDEVTFLVLAEEMTWTSQHYTTRDHPATRDYPYALYRGPLFMHPPLLPYVLKVGFAIGEQPWVLSLTGETKPYRIATRIGLAFELAVHLGWLILCLIAARWWGLGREASAWLLLLAAACPITTFSTARLHTDGIGAIFGFAAVALTVRALQTRSWRLSTGAAAAIILALNARYTGILLPPLLIGIVGSHLYLAACPEDSLRPDHQRLKRRAIWLPTLIVLIGLFTLGLHFYLRFYLTYHTLSPGAINTAAETGDMNIFLQQLHDRSRWDALRYLLILMPLFLLPLLPTFWLAAWSSLKSRRLETWLPVGFVWFAGLWFYFGALQLRYFAQATPFLIWAFAWALDGKPARPLLTWLLRGLGAATLVFGVLSAWYTNWTQVDAAEILPYFALP